MAQISYQIIRSSRKTIALQITPAGQVIVRCPRHMGPEAIGQFVASKHKWLEKHLAELRPTPPRLTEAELSDLARQASAILPERLAHFAPKVGVTYGRVTIRRQRSRWGSCSAKGNLNFNCLLMLTPPEVVDYVVVHELCHCRELNHSARFWAEVERVLPDYRQQRKWLKDNGTALIGRLP